MRYFAILILALIALPAASQTTGEFVPNADSKFWVDGTSNKSEWTVESGALTGRFVVDSLEDGIPVISEVSLAVVAKGLASGRSTIMDRLMHRTLKATAHAEILYEMTGIGDVSKDGDGFVLNTTGSLTIAGVSRDVEIEVRAVPEGDGYRFTGQRDLLMTDFGMDPPTAMFGALLTGDEVVVRFDVVAGPAG